MGLPHPDGICSPEDRTLTRTEETFVHASPTKPCLNAAASFKIVLHLKACDRLEHVAGLLHLLAPGAPNPPDAGNASQR